VSRGIDKRCATISRRTIEAAGIPLAAAETAAIFSAPQIEHRNGRAQSIEQREDIYRFQSDLVSYDPLA